MSEEATTTTTTYGIKETKELVAFGIAFGEALDVSLKNGLGLEDAVHFYQAIQKAGDAFDNVGQVPKEVGDMDAAERKELFDYVTAEFDIADDKLEHVIETALKTALQAAELLEAVKAMKA